MTAHMVSADPAKGSVRLRANAVGMMSGRVASMALGFLFWVVAARLAPPAEVGLTSAVVAAMMLCTQLAQLGIGSAFITTYPDHQRSPGALLDSAMTLAWLAAVLMGAAFLLVAGTWLDELGVVAGRLPWALLFLAMAALGTANVVMDHVSMSLGRGYQVLTRNVVFGLVGLGYLALLAALDVEVSALALFAGWVLMGVAACTLGLVQLRRSVDGYGYRPRVVRDLSRRLMGVGLANHALTLCERLPGLVLPVVVTEILSPEMNAYWYVVWMTAWVVFVAPVSVGVALFAEGRRGSAQLGHALRTSLVMGGVGAVLLALLAEPVLSVLGEPYAAEGVAPLRFLLLAVVPLAFLTAYYAGCRAEGRWAEALTTGAVAAVVSVLVTALAGASGGLVGMAVAWVVVQTAVAGWATWRLWSTR